MKAVKWADVGYTEEPGWFKVRRVSVQVKQEHVEAWLDDPDGRWTVTVFKPLKGSVEATLETFHGSKQR